MLPGWIRRKIYFSVVQRKVLTPNDFTAPDQIRDRTDLSDLLRRIDAHAKAESHALAA